MNKKFYPITIEKRDGFYFGSITELGISIKSNNYDDLIKKCLNEKDDIIENLNKQNIPLPKVIEKSSQLSDLFSLKKISLFFAKTIASSIIFLITISIIAVMFSPFFKNYIDGPYFQDHFNKLSNKMGISICKKDKCE